MPRHGHVLAGLPDGTREALPAVLVLAAIAVPVGFIALSSILGDAALLLALAITAMVLITIALVLAVRRLIAEPPREERDGAGSHHIERTHESQPQSGGRAQRTGGLCEDEASHKPAQRPAKRAATAYSPEHRDKCVSGPARAHSTTVE